MADAPPIKVLFVEDSPEDVEIEERELRNGGIALVSRRVETRPDLLEALASWKPDLVISDYSMPELDGRDALAIVRCAMPDVPFIFVSGTIGEERAIEAMKRGATDYVVKERLAGLLVRVQRAIEEAETRRTRRRLEEDLRQSQKMEALGRLAGGIAQDFNHSLTAMLGYIDLTLAKLGPTNPARGEVEETYRAAESAIGLTRRLLAFSRKAPSDLASVDLNGAIASIAGLLRRLVGGAIECVTILDPGVRPVRADLGALEQVLMNLAVNARDAMPQGGMLEIRTSRVKLSGGAGPTRSLPAGSYAVLQVRDTGVGIAPEALPRIFEPYGAGRPSDPGAGLGLPIVYGLVQSIGGTVAVASELGRGTTFWITLPEEAPLSGRAAAGGAPPLLEGGGRKVVVAEDDPAIRTLVGQILAVHGMEAMEAPDGAHALDLLRAEGDRVSLLVADAVMPRMSGQELARQARAFLPRLPILSMSGLVEIELGPEGSSIEGAGVGFLAKPFTPSALLRQIRRLLEPVPAGGG